MQKISIIIPCFNAGKTLTRALDSVISQKYNKLEIIVINDASTDCTQEVLMQYVESHKEILIKILHHSSNKGVSLSRNEGIAIATGEYVTFLDADDMLAMDFVETIIQNTLASKADCIVCNAIRDKPGKEKQPIYPKFGRKILYQGDFLSAWYCLPFFDTCWGKFYKLDFLRNNKIAFLDNMCFGEDTLFANTVALKSSTTVLLSDYSGYVYFENVDSASKTIEVKQRLLNLQRFIEEFSHQLPEGKMRPLCRKCQEYLWTIKKFGGQEHKRLLSELRISKLWKEFLLPTISVYGKTKHRIIAKLLDLGYIWALIFW